MVIKKIIKSDNADAFINLTEAKHLKMLSRYITFSATEDASAADFLDSRVVEKYSFTSSEHYDQTNDQKREALETMLAEGELQFYYNFKTQVPTIESVEAANNTNYNISNYSMIPFQNYYAKQYEEMMQDMTFIDAPNCYVALKNGQPEQAETKDTLATRHCQNFLSKL